MGRGRLPESVERDQEWDDVQDFELTDQAGRAWRLADALTGSAVVLVFYRGDW